MSYLVIENEGQFPLEALTLAGFTTKRGQAQTIGEFGTGRIYACILALRLGIELYIQTKDWMVQPIIKPIRIQKGEESFEVQQINFEVTYSDGRKEIKETSFTLDMGKNWDSEFQLFREFYVNAYDESLEKPLLYTKSKLTAIDSPNTLVYIKNTNEIQKIYQNIGFYFPFDAPILYQNDLGEIIGVQEGKAGIYVKRVLIFPLDKAIFSYNFNCLELNEERTLKDFYQLRYTLRDFYEACDDIGIMKMVLENMGKTYFENQELPFGSLWLTDDKKVLWRNAFLMVHGQQAVIETSDFNGSMARAFGFKPIKIPYTHQEFISSFVQSDDDVILKNEKMEGLKNMILKKETVDLREMLMKVKETFIVTKRFFETTLNAEVEFSDEIQEPIMINQGIIIINQKSVITEMDLAKLLLRGYIMLENDIDFRQADYIEKVEENAVRVIDQFYQEILSHEQSEEEMELEYDEDKKRLYLPIHFVDAMNPKVYATVVNGTIIFQNASEQETRIWQTKITSKQDQEPVFSISINVNFDSKKGKFWFKVPNRLLDVKDFAQAVYYSYLRTLL